MKKMLIVLMVALSSSNSSAFKDLQATRHACGEEQRTTFLDASSSMDEYAPKEDCLQNIDEYDQNVTDNVNPPTISTAEAMFKEILGALLVRYISLQEIARIYFKEAKDVLMQWYHNILKA